MATEILLAALFFILLGAAYVKGYDAVKSRFPQHLVHFYLIMATARMLLVGTVVALCVLLASSHEEAVRRALIYIIMYGAMMVVTLILRH